MACDCPNPRNTSLFFSKEARSYARRYQKRGLAREQKLLIDAICGRPVEGASILDIGCGVGGVHLTLLGRGARQVTGIDIAEGMIEGAKLLAGRLGFAGRTRYLVGDAVSAADELPAADLVVMDKVVCCYENLPALLAAAVAKTRSTLALTYPRPTAFVRSSMKLMIALRKLLRRPFLPSLHDWNGMVREIEAYGFRQRVESRTLIWSVAVFDRVGGETAAGG